jgi:elongation factor Ts
LSITATEVKALRERTGAGMMECKSALEEAGGDAEKAIEVLRVRGQAKAAKRGGREAAEGVVSHYVHTNGRIGALVEVNCETDFVARNDEFIEFARNVALHVAAMGPHWVSEADVPEDAISSERAIFEQQAADKPIEIRTKIADGRVRKWLAEVVLLDQEHVNTDKHGGRTIEDLRAEISSRTGENVVIRRFARFKVGE